MNKKKIGVVMHRNTSVGGVNVTGINSAYLEWASQFGEVFMVNPLQETVFDWLDLLILPGGEDVLPSRNGNKPSYFTQRSNPTAEWFDANILPQYIETGVPVFGICRGFQSLLDMEGERIVQHIKLPSSSPRDERLETMNTTIFGPEVHKINSIHHQGIYELKPDSEFTTLGKSQEFGTIEAVLHRTKSIAAVQYHPEETNCPFAVKLVHYLLED